jgi:hypothetical protein
MSGFGIREARISQERKPRVYHCGECGVEISSTELLCDVCAHSDTSRWEPLHEMERRTR